MENGPELTPRGPKWPNKARKCILTPIRIHPCASQPLAAHLATPQAIFHPNPDPFFDPIRPNPSKSWDGDLNT